MRCQGTKWPWQIPVRSPAIQAWGNSRQPESWGIISPSIVPKDPIAFSDDDWGV